jgi:hypothetical protein
MNRARFAAFLSLSLLALSFAGPATAQAPLEPAQLPARTVFYVIWRGMPAADVRKTNSLFALWDDPGLSATRAAMAQSLFDSSKQKDSNTPPFTAADWDEYAPLFDNSYVLGFLTNPKKSPATPPAAGTKPPEWNGVFFVYDRTGKETLLAKALLRMRAGQKESPEMSQTTIAGLPAVKFTSKTGSTYWVEKGKYLVSGGERSVMEEILARLDGKSVAGSLTGSPARPQARPTLSTEKDQSLVSSGDRAVMENIVARMNGKPTTPGSLAETAAYQEAQPNLGHGALEIFLRIPDLKEFAADIPAQQGFKVQPMLDALRLDAIHSIYGQVVFAGPKTHLQGAILGDASAGTLFDIFSDGAPTPAALAFASPETVYFNSTRLNFNGIYATVKRAMRSVFPQGQQGNADLIDTIAQTRLGMPVADALALLTGEFASIQSSPVMDMDKQIYFLGIRNKPDTLKLIRTLFSAQISSERAEGDTTFLKVSLGGSQSAAGVAQFNFYHVAVTPDAILGAHKLDTLHQILAQRAQNTAPGFASLPQFQVARVQFPANIDGLNYVDFKKVDWLGLKDHWIREMKKATTAKTLAGQKATPAPATPVPAWIEQIDPQVFARHLHSAFAASWKDAKGFHFEEWLD